MKTVSQKLAKQLQEAGYPQEGSLYFIDGIADDGGYELVYRMIDDGFNYDLFGNGVIVAPTADEILEKIKKDTDVFYWDEGFGRWTIEFGMMSDGIKKVEDESLADAAAKMWLYLKREELLA